MADITLNKTAVKKRRNFIADLVFRMITEKPLGTAGLIITVVFLATAIFANYLAPYAPNQLHGLSALKGTFRYNFGWGQTIWVGIC